MVIGGQKKESIQKDPLLRWYFELFEQALNEGNRRLLVSGYGFRDEHINCVMARAIEGAGLELFILDPTPPDKLIGRIGKTADGSTIVDGIRGFFPLSLRVLFPRSEFAPGQHANIMFKTFFETT